MSKSHTIIEKLVESICIAVKKKIADKNYKRR